MYIPINPNIKPARGIIYASAVVMVSSGFLLLWSDDFGAKKFGWFLIGSGVLYLFLGLLIVYESNIINIIVGKNQCPYCRKNTISAKRKLKASWFKGSTYCRCPSCNIRLKVPSWVVLLVLFLLSAGAVTPISVGMAFESYMLWFVLQWLFVSISLYVYVRFIPLKVT